MTAMPLAACRRALASTLSAPLDKNGYVADLGQNLIEDVKLEDFEADLRQGDGNELEGKFRAAHSSSALAVNNFAAFKRNIAHLTLPGGGPFTEIQFERKCFHGLAGRRAPNLDVLAQGINGIVAIESKCLEYLTPHVAHFAPVYDAGIRDSRREHGWFVEMQRLAQSPRKYRWLDAAQLIKHSFGLAHTFPGQFVTLLYLFWEPLNAVDHPVFAEHRAEIANFAEAVKPGGPNFRALSYPELWGFWEKGGDGLRNHVRRLRARYGVAI